MHACHEEGASQACRYIFIYLEMVNPDVWLGVYSFTGTVTELGKVPGYGGFEILRTFPPLQRGVGYVDLLLRHCRERF